MRIFIFSFILFLIVGCEHSTYKYSYMDKIAKQLKIIHKEMKEIAESSNSTAKLANTREETLSILEDIQYEIDALPKVEVEIDKNNPEKSRNLNDKLSPARDLRNKIQDIEDLLYYAYSSDNYTYFETVANDPALEARINNIIERVKQKGFLIPLDDQYRNIKTPETKEDANIIIEYSNL